MNQLPIQPSPPVRRMHQDPGQIPPEVPNVPSPQPDIQPGRTPEPEMPPPSEDPYLPDSPTGPEIEPDTMPQEIPPSPRMGAGRWLH